MTHTKQYLASPKWALVASMPMAVLLFLSLSICFSSCKQEPKAKQEPAITKVEPAASAASFAFNRDSALAFVQQQVDFGPRVPNTPAHRACATWLSSKLESFGAKVQVQDFRAKSYDKVTFKAFNIIGAYNPAATRRILLMAHWDSRRVADNDKDPKKHTLPVMGANDGASGVGVLLEVARNLQDFKDLDIGVDILLVDVEDQGSSAGSNAKSWCLGAQHWAKYPHVPGYKAEFGILLDMVGDRKARFPKEGTSMRYAPEVMNKVWDLAKDLGYSNYFDQSLERAITDDHRFINEMTGIPTIDIIDLRKDTEDGFFQHWHTDSDNMKNIDKRTLKAVGNVILHVIDKSNEDKF